VVVADVVVFTLEDFDLDFFLIVVDGIEYLAAGGRERGVAMDDRREPERKVDAVQVIETADAERVRRDVHENGADVGAGDEGSLNAGAHGNAEVGIDLLMGALAEPFLEQFRDERGAGGAADEHDLIDGAGVNLASSRARWTQSIVRIISGESFPRTQSG